MQVLYNKYTADTKSIVDFRAGFVESILFTADWNTVDQLLHVDIVWSVY